MGLDTQHGRLSKIEHHIEYGVYTSPHIMEPSLVWAFWHFLDFSVCPKVLERFHCTLAYSRLQVTHVHMYSESDHIWAKRSLNRGGLFMEVKYMA